MRRSEEEDHMFALCLCCMRKREGEEEGRKRRGDNKLRLYWKDRRREIGLGGEGDNIPAAGGERGGGREDGQRM